VGRVYKSRIQSSDNGANHTNQSLWSAGAIWTTGVPYCCKASASDFTTLSPSGGTCYGLPGGATSFPATYSWNAIDDASGYHITISHSEGGLCLDIMIGKTTTLNLSSAQQQACNAKGTGAFNWTINATYDGGCAPSATATSSFKFDKSPPVMPMPTIAFSPESVSCPGKYKATLSWNAVNDNAGDCAGIDTLPYTSVVSTSNTYSPPATGWDTNWTAVRTQTSSSGWAGGTQIYGEVKARDSKGNESVWSKIGGGTGETIPVPTPFPTIYIYGNYIEDTGTTAPICSGQMTIDPSLLSINLNVSGPGVTPICTPHDTWYECTIAVDNINTPCATIDHSVALDGSYGIYEPGEWREQSTCVGDPVPTIMITMGPFPPGPSPTPANIYFPYGSASGGWFKEKNTGFYNRKTRNNLIPNNPLAFDAIDDTVVPPNDKYLIIGAAGAVLNGGSINLGPNATNNTGQGSEVSYSSSNWGVSSYTASSLFSPAKFTDYTKSRKQYTTITKPDLSEIVASGMYYLKDNLIINASNVGIFKDKNIILFSDTASVTILNNIDNDNSDGFTLGTGALGIVADTITINNTLSEIDAILIGNTVNIGTSGVKLKIKGNLINLDGTFTNKRSQDNAQYPSLFVIFDPKTYLDLLPYLSISMYDWKQVQ
ncbi:hypothetical protein COY90_04150, partial [Candidatus Roizmanbacteria bacterium CG_4_10_14_0_8_um_filter_39_9]